MKRIQHAILRLSQFGQSVRLKRGLRRRRAHVAETLETRGLLAATVSNASFLASGTLTANATSLTVSFSEPVLGGTTEGNYELRRAGADGLLGNTDDPIVTISSVSMSGNAATLNFPALPEDVYRLTVKDTITDADGTALDGDGNGTAGGNWRRDFVANVGGTTLDPLFGTGGRVQTNLSGETVVPSEDIAQTMAVQADGKILVASYTRSLESNGTDVAVTRYLANGSLDTSFGVAGTALIDFGGDQDQPTGIAIQNDGAIVVSGYFTLYATGEGQFAVARLTSSGQLDTTFDGDGKLTFGFGVSTSSYSSAGVAISGTKIIVGGYSGSEFAVAQLNSDGTFDSSFDGDGKLTFGFGSPQSGAEDMVVAPDGKIVLVGYSYNGVSYDMAVARLNPSGTFDGSFDGDGRATVDFGGGFEFATAVAVQPGLEIVIAGNGSPSSDYRVARLTNSGQLDTSFDGDGKLTVNFNSGIPQDVALQGSQIVIAGYASFGNGGDFTVMRLNSDGSFDTTFDGDGKFNAANVSNDYTAAMALTDNGNRILLAGYAANNVSGIDIQDVVLVQVTANGVLDASFGTGGRVQTNLSGETVVPSEDTAQSMAVQADGKILVASQTRSLESNGTDVAVTRYLANGSLDTSFGVAGTALIDFGGDQDQPTGIAIQNDGAIVVSGYFTLYATGEGQFAVARLTSSGQLDTTFDGDGKLTFGFGVSTSSYSSAGVAISGTKIIVGGYSGSEFAVAQLNSDGTFDSSFDGDGKLTFGFGSPQSGAEDMVVAPDGKIVLVGYSYNGVSYDMAVARLNPSGTFDGSFDGDGRATVDFGGGFEFATAVAVQPGLEIVIAGNGSPSSDYRVARLTNSGQLDTSFDGDGKLTVNFNSGIPQDVALQGSQIVIAGYASFGNGGDFTVMRLNSDGSFDTTFDGDGKFNAANVSNDYTAAMALTDNGNRILLAGYAANNVSGIDIQDVVLVQVTANGVLDASFGTGGRVQTNLSGETVVPSEDTAQSMAVQADGKILVASQTRSLESNGTDVAVTRYLANGSLDTSFGVAGTALIDFGGDQDQPTGIAIQNDGAIVVSGYFTLYATGEGQFAVARLTSSGQLDTTFDGDGKLTFGFGVSTSSYSSAGVAISGTKIIVGGYSGSEFAVAQLNSDGTFDSSFDGDGKLTFGFGSPQSGAEDMVVAPDGKIVLVGYSYNGVSYDMAVARLNPSGTFDGSFDGDGRATVDFGGGFEFATAVAVQPGLEIVIAGNGSPSSDYRVARLTNSGQLDTSFDGDGKLTVNFNSGIPQDVALQGSQIVIAGYASFGNGGDFTVMRLNSDGSFDTTFDGDGKFNAANVSNDYTAAMALTDNGNRILLAGMQPTMSQALTSRTWFLFRSRINELEECSRLMSSLLM